MGHGDTAATWNKFEGLNKRQMEADPGQTHCLLCFLISQLGC